MGMCAIYTAVRPPSPDELLALAKTNEGQTYGAQRCTLGRTAMAELVVAVVPASHATFARTVLDRDLWSFMTPAATRGNHAAALARVHTELALTHPLWPSTTELACLVGVSPAHYIGNNLVLLPPALVDAAVTAFEQHEAAHEPAEILNGFLRKAQRRRDAVLLHWDFR